MATKPRLGALCASLVLLCAMASAARAEGETLVLTAQTPGGGALFALDPVSGARTRYALWPGTDLAGLGAGPAGEIYVLDHGLGTAPARVLRVDTRAGTSHTLSSGGFLCEPSRCLVTRDGSLLVLDRAAVGGTGALLRIDVRNGSQRLLSFGGSFERPAGLALEPSGAPVVLDRRLVALDGRTGAQAVVPLSPCSWSALDAWLSAGQPFLSDGVRVVCRDETGTPRVARLPVALRDVVRACDGAFYGAWSGGGEGRVLRAAAGGAFSTLAHGAELADVRGISSVAMPFPGASLSDAAQLDAPFHAPPRPTLPPVTIEVRPTTVTLLHGPGPEDDEVLPGGPYPLVTALRAAEPGSEPILGVYGEIPGTQITIGGGDADTKGYVVHWGTVPMRFAVVGMTSDARIHEFSVWQKMNDGRVNGGVVDALFQNLTIEARYSQCAGAPEGHRFGLLRFYDCRFVPGSESLAHGEYGGYGYKWGIRAQGRGRWDLRGCTFAPVEEHAVYLDSPQGDSYFIDFQHLGSTRTAIQVVNRSFDNPGQSGFGTLLFEDVRINGLWGDGGSGITVAGHLGDLVFRRIKARESPRLDGSHGAIVVWADDASFHGMYLHRGLGGRLYTTGRVFLESTDVELPRADRALVAISGAEQIVVDGFTLAGSRVALSFDSPYGTATWTGPAVVDGALELLDRARIANGRVTFRTPCPLSAYPGFQAAGKIQFANRLLSDAEIDQLFCGP